MRVDGYLPFISFAVEAAFDRGLMVTVISRNPVHSVLWLILAFHSVRRACLFCWGPNLSAMLVDHRLCGRGRGVVFVCGDDVGHRFCRP